jgi:hypothetical protein
MRDWIWARPVHMARCYDQHVTSATARAGSARITRCVLGGKRLRRGVAPEQSVICQEDEYTRLDRSGLGYD